MATLSFVTKFNKLVPAGYAVGRYVASKLIKNQMLIVGWILVSLGLAELLSGRAWIIDTGEYFPKWSESKSTFFTSVGLKIIVGLSLIIFQ